MIKFKFRKNLLYLLVFLVSWNVRAIVFILIDNKFAVTLNFTFLYLMCLAEILGGLCLYLFQHCTKRNNKETNFFAANSANVNPFFKGKRVADGTLKIAVLLFFAAFFDFYVYKISKYFVPLVKQNLSYSVDDRLSSIQLISSALICTYALGFKMKKHHKFALIAIGSCLILTLACDGIFVNGGSARTFFYVYFLIFFYQIMFSFNCCIEKYLVDVDFMNPFKILMIEGAIMFIMSVLTSISRDPFKELRDVFQKYKHAGDRALFIFLLVLLFLLSIIVNIYKVYSNVIYSPMARSIAHFILNPINNIYYFIKKDDFNHNIICLILSEILCIATDFFAFVYNEYLILFCCDLEVETVDIISERASRLENIPIQELYEEEEEEEEEEKEEKDDKKDNCYNNHKNKSKNNKENVIVVDNYSFSI